MEHRNAGVEGYGAGAELGAARAAGQAEGQWDRNQNQLLFIISIFNSGAYTGDQVK
jgi:hypothetical protein